jgi:monoamine oxidase
VWHATNGQSGPRGVLQAFPISVHSRRVTAMPEHERISFALQHVEPIFPGLKMHFEGGVTKCWDEDEWARGASAYYKPGQFRSLLPHVARPEGRIHFAGEHTSVWGDGWMQGALESGNRVAREVNAAANVTSSMNSRIFRRHATPRIGRRAAGMTTGMGQI